MKLIFIFDQIQAGLGGKEKGDQPLGGKILPIGAAKMFEAILPQVNGEIIATLYCGDDYFEKNSEECSLKLTAMVKKLQPDVVVCGPCFNYEKFAEMAGRVAKTITEKLDIPVLAAMSAECQSAIMKYQSVVPIVKMPKKGGTGLTESLEKMMELAVLMTDKKEISSFVQENCYGEENK